MNTGKWSDAIGLAKHRLQLCPVDLRFHHFLSIALVKSGRHSEGDVHKRWAIGLMEDIKSSGNGESPDTAFKTISVGEEYDMLNAFALRPIKRKLVEHNGVMLDKITAANRQGREFELYFYPEAHFRRMQEMSN